MVLDYSGLTGRVVVPGDPEYERARQEWNIAIDKYPRAIVYCYTTGDVANAVLWSRRQGVELRIRSGGHNYEGFSVGDNVLVIDTSYMNNVRVNSCEDTVTVQAGTRLLDLYDTLSRHGYAFPGGTCPTVAISGLVLGGGLGLSARYLGLTADSLLGAEMVDANGQVLAVNECSNADLFWALRGAGGGNFGVVTAYKFRLHKVEKITLIQLEWYNNKPARLAFLRRWQILLKELDCRMSAFGGSYKVGAWFNAFFYGLPQEAEQILEPLLAIPGISSRRIEYVDVIDAVKAVGDY
jgi:FAD/FMN-containing dehydrogenase